MSLKENILEKKGLLIILGMLIFVISGTLVGLIKLGESSNQIEQPLIISSDNSNMTPQVKSTETSGSETKVTEISETSSSTTQEELEAEAVVIMEDLESLSAEQQKILEKIESVGVALQKSTEAIEHKTMKIEQLKKQN